MVAKTKVQKLTNFAVAAGVIGAGVGNAILPFTSVSANPPTESSKDCPSLRVVFARGSGAPRDESGDYLAFKESIETKLQTTDLDYEFIDLDYPALAVGFDSVEEAADTIGAYFGGGEAYSFGQSVADGAKNLVSLVNSPACPNTKYVLGGYSQGAIVISKAAEELMSGRIIYATTFGNPKIYLPEGEGLIPAACKGENLSSYRMYVPDCRAYKGLLGYYEPFVPAALEGKVGTWCNGLDVFCSSFVSLPDHISYEKDGLYEDAAKVIFDKITRAFEIENHLTSPHDTAILIDSTSSMREMISQYKAEALRLAQETFESGGRVALYDYRDLSDPYQPRLHCDFTTCTPELFREELERIEVDAGGDLPESLLSASLHVMQEQAWKQGATKSLVVLTDASFHSPDLDGTTMDEVIKLSKIIDPVNFYIITDEEDGASYADLAVRTGGKVVTNMGELSLLTDYIMSRYDSLPQVMEDDALIDRPTLTVNSIKKDGQSVTIDLHNTGDTVIVALNEAILGQTTQNIITIGELSDARENIISLTPVKENVKGESMQINLAEISPTRMKTSESADVPTSFIPKAPNTGHASKDI